MARIRSIHPGLFADEAFVSCQPLARLLLLGIWTESDDYGVFEWKPVTLKIKAMAVDMADVPALLAELEGFDIIKRATIDGKPYGLVRNFCRYQRPKKPTHRVPLPRPFWNYVGLNADGSRPNPNATPTTSEPKKKPFNPNRDQVPPGYELVPNQSPTGAGKSAQMEDGGDSREEEGDSNHIDKPVVVVVPREPETSAGTTTTTKAENELALQEEPAKAAVNPLGTALPENWIPDDDCMKIAFDSGIDGAEVESEVIRFHALNAQRGTFSQNWNKTWTLWCAEFKRRKAKEAAKAPPRVEVSKGEPGGFDPTEKDWEFVTRHYARNGYWNAVLYGPEPTSPACRCPPDILAKYIVNHAAVPVLAARAAQVPA